MNNQTKVVLGAIAAVFAVSLIIRFAVLSQAGVPGMWIFYLGLPFGGIVTVLVLLLRLGLLNFAERPTAIAQHWPQQSPPQPAPASQRLEELEALLGRGAISDIEYAEKRARIIAGI
jgi:uncharacterized membrane protein